MGCSFRSMARATRGLQGSEPLLDDATSRQLGAAARAHARRADQDGEQIARQFEALMESVVSGHARATW